MEPLPKRYLVEPSANGWKIICIQGKKKTVRSLELDLALDCEVVDLLRAVLRSRVTEKAVELAFEIDPHWQPPCYLPEWFKEKYGRSKAKRKPG